jgi:ATP-dependent Zn protease
MYHLPTQDQVMNITIVPRGQSLGATWHIPRDDSFSLTRNQMYEEIVSLLGGRVAEALFLQDISVGASNDIDRASKLARDMIGRYGMSKTLGTVSYTGGEELFIGRDFERTKSYSEKVAGTMDDEVKALHRGIRQALQAGIRRQGATLRDYRRPDGSSGGMQAEFKVYGRDGEPCPRCGAPLEKTRIAGRGTWFCGVCQR